MMMNVTKKRISISVSGSVCIIQYNEYYCTK